jgi:limonene-1,2-epoxide hydrolase
MRARGGSRARRARAVLEPFFAPTIANEFVVKHAVADGPVVFLERIARHPLEAGWFEFP